MQTDELEMFPSEAGPDPATIQRDGTGQKKLKWLLIAYAIDRSAFLIYVFVFLLTLILSFFEII